MIASQSLLQLPTNQGDDVRKMECAALAEALHRERAISDELRAILAHTNDAIILLDDALRIRFYNPAVQLLVRIIPSDIGRPFSDLRAVVGDDELASDALRVLKQLSISECEFHAANDRWYARRVLPYHDHALRVVGVVITFVDITDLKRAEHVIAEERRRAEEATDIKSRFLSTASHDLRQPVQNLILLVDLLDRSVKESRADSLVQRMQRAVSTIVGKLNALIDMSHISTGTVPTDVHAFPIAHLLNRLHDTLGHLAEAKQLDLRVLGSDVIVRSDPRLLEHILTNLITNALTYTVTGGVLVGCRIRAGMLRIEVWDTGVGIPEHELFRVFEEYHQLQTTSRDKVRGLGLGLSVVKELADALGHPISVRSRSGKGSVFTVHVAISSMQEVRPKLERTSDLPEARARVSPRVGFADVNAGGGDRKVSAAPLIFVVDDDALLRESICELLQLNGYVAIAYVSCELFLTAYDGSGAACLIVDAHLPGMSGIELLDRLSATGMQLPSIVMAGFSDIATAVQAMKAGAIEFIEKPFVSAHLLAAVAGALEQARSSSGAEALRRTAVHHVGALTPRQAQIMHLVVAGEPSKNIAAALRISQRTVENHRAEIMRRMDAHSLPELARAALLGQSADGWSASNGTRSAPPHARA